MLKEYTNQIDQSLQKSWTFLPDEKRPRVEVDEGRKYYKVVIQHEHQRTVHSFVEKVSLDVYKAASWNAPAKGVRYNLIRDMETLKNVVDWAGGYLYGRR